MKIKLKRIICLAAAAVLLCALTVKAQTADYEPEDLIDGIIAYNLKETNSSDIEQWINGELTKNAGAGSEWYALALSQYGDYDLTAYEAALIDYLSQNRVASASSRQKYALALIAAGSTDPYIYTTLHNSFGRMGVMSWIFGLHILNNGYTESEYTLSETVNELLSLQLSDGGWAVMGKNGDVDVTAMAVQALAPHCKTDKKVAAAVDKALLLLSGLQGDNGDYAGNPESTAQVLAALSALGIDCKTDSRFIKNGNTLFDGIGIYRLPDGSFCHKAGGGESTTATVQVFYSMVSYLRMQGGKTGILVFDARIPAGLRTPKSSTQTVTVGERRGSYKPWVCLLVVLVALGVCGLLYALKKRSIKNFLVVAVVCTLALAAVIFTDISMPEDYYNSVSVKEKAIGTVTLTIRCDTVPDKSAAHIPDDGTVLALTKLEIEQGDTVYDILTEATTAERIHLETTGSGDAVYVEGINNIYELDFGSLSGWQYRVNGEAPSESCSEYELSVGDKIEWLYTCNLGEDVK